MATDKVALLAAIKDSDEFKAGKVWSAIEESIAEESEGKKYEAFVEYVGNKYGDLAELAILLSSYYGQVCNGGHRQYFDNGYASQGGGCFKRHDTSCDLHRRMKNLFRVLGLKRLDISAQIHAIMEDFLAVMSDYEEPTDEDYADEEYVNPLDSLDNRFYDINDKWRDELEVWFKDQLIGENNAVANA